MAVAIGRFVDKKAPYYTILAFNKALEQHPDAKLVFAGDGPLHYTCQNLVKYLKIENNVILPGVISQDKLREYLQEARTFIQHSITIDRGDTEGTPLAIMEASASALPIVSTKHGGTPYAVLENETGFLVEEHDVDGMTNYICKLLEDKDLAKNMGAKGRERMLKHFNIEDRLQSLSDVIYRAVN